MHRQLSSQKELQVYSFYPSFENIHGIIAEFYLYVFDRQGRLIEGETVRGGKAIVALTEDELVGAHLVLGPSLEGLVRGPVTLDDVAPCHVFDAGWTYEAGRKSYSLEPVPENIWRWWLVHSLWGKLRHKLASQGL